MTLTVPLHLRLSRFSRLFPGLKTCFTISYNIFIRERNNNLVSLLNICCPIAALIIKPQSKIVKIEVDKPGKDQVKSKQRLVVFVWVMFMSFRGSFLAAELWATKG
jgi:hypothetical protein